MGSDLMTTPSTFSELVQKYENFIAPAYKITIGGKDVISDCKMYPDNLNISLSLDNSSSVSVNLTGIYDSEKTEFASSVSSDLSLGNIVEVKIGYGSSLELIFKGYIHEVSANFSDVPSVTVTAMDVRRLMMEYRVDNFIHTASSYSDAFESVMKKYKKLADTEVKSTDTLKEGDNTVDGIVQRGSDYDFVNRVLCKKVEREFFVFADTAYYRTPKANTSSAITLEWGTSLISFSKNTIYKDTAIQVMGYNMQKENVTAEATASSDSKLAKPMAESQKKIIICPDLSDLSRAEKYVKREAEKEKSKSQRGSGKCIGLPQIVPGRFITLKKMDSKIDGDYYVTKVDHSIGSDGFTTSFEIGGYG